MTLAIANGTVPARNDHPSTLSNAAEEALWKLLLVCWSKDPADRPPMKAVMDGVRSIATL
jgi:hypothetical protein